MKKLDYYVIDVLSVVNNLPFDYVNSYETLEEAKNEAERLIKEKDGIVRILVIKWNRFLNDDNETLYELIDEDDDVFIKYEGRNQI